MQEQNEISFLREIEEEMHRQRFEALWKKYGMQIMAFALAVVVVTAASVTWKNYKLNAAHTKTAALAEIVLHQDENKPAEYMQALLSYEKAHGASAQSAVARLYAAKQALSDGDSKQALDLYAALSDDKNVPPVYSQLASLLYALVDLDAGDPAALEARLKPLMDQKSIWRFMAYELAGHLAFRAGDKEKAKNLFVELVNMEGTPPGIAQRASDMLLLVIGGKPE